MGRSGRVGGGLGGTSAGDIALVFGTRPEIIKLAGIALELGGRARLVHTGQHFDQEMSGAFFANFDLPQPAVHFAAATGPWGRGHQIGSLISALTREFTERPPAAAIVQGDTNSTSAGAQAAHYCGVPVVHVEAGLRSGDRTMPEEINRQVVGALADLHCAPTTTAVANLVAAGVDPGRIRLTGNTVVEATLRSLPDEAGGRALAARHGLSGDYVLATVHRPENSDDPVRLARLLEALGGLGVPVLFPVHPRTRRRIEEFGLGPAAEGLLLTDPVDHPTFLGLAARARLLVSDSGGIQEEATVIKKPLLVVRTSTERPEAVEAGFARLVEPGPALLAAGRRVLADPGIEAALREVPSPYGDGTASALISRLTTELADGRGPGRAAA
ncbi:MULTISPECIES: non-hydrolyzing UDP-N-acetylglucosamine 2-epimerase [unclassified Streptomyces]|uniref:non-hydrolyzing UDP-N-acetylglucosamine 2-epimerase n=1 Tax=unclassified Streptomyces TaxID=2593676 RepID=UPI002E2BCE15|nr:UDP-N-acetylglucosamine 2-epimerase (non-hydrolyzing) [Streptomyces sp. NBC_00223]